MIQSNSIKPKLFRIANIPESHNIFCRGLFKRLSEEYEVVVIASPGQALKEIEERERVRTVAVPIERHISIFKDIASLWKLVRVFHKERPTIIHTLGGKCGLLSMIAGWLTRVPIRMFSFTGLDSPTAKGLLHYVLWCTDKISCVLATDLLPEGFGVKRDIEKMHLTHKPLTVLGNGNLRGIDLAYYAPLNDLQKQADLIRVKCENNFVFLFVGRIVRDKGVNELVSAFNRLCDLYPNISLLLVGPYENNLDPISKEAQALIDNKKNIISVGKQDDVRPWYMAADCFILPSYREGVPNSVLEAGAMNLPSIVTDINGANEIIIDGENGVIIQPRDVDSLYNAMKNIIDNDEMRNYMKSNARKLVADRYEQGFVYQCLIDYYKKAISRLRE